VSKKLVLDSFALVSLFHKEPGWEKVRAALYEQQRAGTKAFPNWINWGKFFYIIKRKVWAGRAAEALHLLEQLPIELVPIHLPLVLEAAEMKGTYAVSYADAFASRPPNAYQERS
jgi:predicted nucleic acid-binding protein